MVVALVLELVAPVRPVVVVVPRALLVAVSAEDVVQLGGGLELALLCILLVLRVQPCPLGIGLRVRQCQSELSNLWHGTFIAAVGASAAHYLDILRR